MLNSEESVGDWLDVAAWDDVPVGGTLPVIVDGVDGAGAHRVLYRIGDRVFATAALCTHGDADLSDGFLDGEEIVCPYHAGRFHVPTGRPCGLPCEVPLATFAVRRTGARIEVARAPTTPGAVVREGDHHE